jgi:L-seryl-tRNA(Ser) seleniumtransferase
MEPPGGVNRGLRGLPAVDRLVDAASRGTTLARWSLLAAARAELSAARGSLVAGDGGAAVDPEELAARVRARAERLERAAPRRVINATGVVIHTNLGRAPLAPEAAGRAAEAALGYSDLEFDLESGERGSRLSRVAELLVLLSGAEAALVVNNNAAAVLLAVDALAAGRQVVLSRGELVEIGGSFRVPEILESTRARLVAVGTTNRTHLSDYADAIGPETGLLLKVHRSNFEMRGFTAEVGLRELAALAAERGLPLVEDRGSGTFLDLRPHGIPEAPAAEGLRQGADLVLFSGDKLLGGPQAGIALGRAELIERMRRSPLARALRVDKLVLAALDRTLRFYLDGSALARVPVLRMLLRSPDELRRSAEALARSLRAAGWAAVELEAESGLVGGGALPDLSLPGTVVRLTPRGNGGASAAEMARALRTGTPSVVVRVQRGALVIDPRTLQDEDAAELVSALARLI